MPKVAIVNHEAIEVALEAGTALIVKYSPFKP